MAVAERIIYQDVDRFRISYPERAFKYMLLLTTFAPKSRKNEGKWYRLLKKENVFLDTGLILAY